MNLYPHINLMYVTEFRQVKCLICSCIHTHKRWQVWMYLQSPIFQISNFFEVTRQWNRQSSPLSKFVTMCANFNRQEETPRRWDKPLVGPGEVGPIGGEGVLRLLQGTGSRSTSSMAMCPSSSPDMETASMFIWGADNLQNKNRRFLEIRNGSKADVHFSLSIVQNCTALLMIW